MTDWYAHCAYAPEQKHRFHVAARARLRRLAAELGFPSSSFDLRSNQGGIAVSGEITLHHERIYVQVCQPATGADTGILIRTRGGQRDYTGGRNHSAPLSLLDDLPALAARVRAVMAARSSMTTPREEEEAAGAGSSLTVFERAARGFPVPLSWRPTMTDKSSTADYDAYQDTRMAQARERDRLAKEALAMNKTALFDVLAAAGIDAATVSFDGYGDSGQIEAIEARAADQPVGLPSSSVEIAQPRCDGFGLTRSTLPLAEAIETLAYALLEETHGGWENMEGACGNFTFTVADRTISLEHNERFIDYETYEHTF